MEGKIVQGDMMVKRDFIRNVLGLLLVLLLVVGLRLFVFSTASISEAESNSYLRAGDFVVINKNKTPKRLDFVQYSVQGKTYIGRIVAEAGDSVIYMDDIFYRNNQAEEEPYLADLRAAYTPADISANFTDDFDLASITGQNLTTVPEKEYLILNDNRQNQADSRQFGLIKQAQIKGVVDFRLWPMDDFGFIQNR